MKSFFNCLAAEWIKKRRSFADWLVWVGAFFIPAIKVVIFLVYPAQLIGLQKSPEFWTLLFFSNWQVMSLLLLPMGIVLAVSLVTQLEYKNNTWKQLHVTPVSFSSIYFSKLMVLIVMLLQLLVLFNIGIYLSAVIPALLKSSIPFPSQPLPFFRLLAMNGNYFIMCMPILLLQYLLSLQIKNGLVPIGIGLAFVIGSLTALSWKYIYIIPTAYIALAHLQNTTPTATVYNLRGWAFAYSMLFTALGYILYLFKKEKG